MYPNYPDDPFYTVEETAKILKLPVTSCYDLVRQKKIPAVKLGKHWRISREGIEYFTFAQKTEGNQSHTVETNNVILLGASREAKK